ncbi:interferon gamma 1-like [Pempheris klunzingeri]|uniref:interferon gamma 1-like n=1 Tax=Pempheris klunzingeri TaxID=3127111 RepID=UPI00397FAD00
MSPCSGSMCLLVLLGVVLTSGGPIHCVSDSLKKAHESIADVLKLTKPEISGYPLFGSVIRSINASCQRKEEIQLMNATLDIYMRIFSSILQHDHSAALLDKLSASARPQVESALTELQQEMEKLKRHLGHLNHLNHEREDVLSELNKIKVDDPLVQKKALAQFNEIYQVASVIGSRRCGHAHSRSAK